MSLVLDTFNQLMGSDADTSSKIFRGLLLVVFLTISAWILSSAYKGIALDNLTKEDFVSIAIRLSLLFCILTYFILS